MNKHADQEAYNQLSIYTLEHALRDRSFIHQYVVDTYAAQHADINSKKIYVAFSLAGLYLHLEKGYTGKQVQMAHIELAKNKAALPVFDLPTEQATMNARDVLKFEPGPERDQAINKWSAAVWQIWQGNRAKVVDWIKNELGI